MTTAAARGSAIAVVSSDGPEASAVSCCAAGLTARADRPDGPRRSAPTEGSTLVNLEDLEEGRCSTRRKLGRRTHCTADEHQHFHRPTLSTREIGELPAVRGPASPPGRTIRGDGTTGSAENRRPRREGAPRVRRIAPRRTTS